MNNRDDDTYKYLYNDRMNRMFGGQNNKHVYHANKSSEPQKNNNQKKQNATSRKDNEVIHFNYDENFMTPKYVYIVLAVIVSLGFAALVFMKEPVSNYINTRAVEKQIELSRQETINKYSILESDISQALVTVEQTLILINQEKVGLYNQVEENVGISVIHLLKYPSERPEQLDKAILESSRIAVNWADIVNSITSQYPPGHIKLKIADIKSRVANKQLISTDRAVLAELLGQYEKEAKLFQKRKDNLEELTKLINRP